VTALVALGAVASFIASAPESQLTTAGAIKLAAGALAAGLAAAGYAVSRGLAKAGTEPPKPEPPAK